MKVIMNHDLSKIPKEFFNQAFAAPVRPRTGWTTNKPCRKCGHDHFRTEMLQFGKRHVIACMKCGTLHAYVEGQGIPDEQELIRMILKRHPDWTDEDARKNAVEYI